MSKKIRELDLLIIGAGPAGMSASIYATRAKLNTLVLEDAIVGGQVTSTYMVENYPGLPDILGSDLAAKFQEHAEHCGAEIDEFDSIESVSLTDEEKIVETSDYIYKPKTLIIATGANPRRLPVPEEEKFYGKGVHYCGICDGAMYEGKRMAVVGGGNAALEEAELLSKFGKVYIIRRYDYFRGEKLRLEAVEKNENIEILWNQDIKHINGDNFVTSVTIEDTKTNELSELKVDGVFGAIGTQPKSDLFKEYLNLTDDGHIITDEDMQTNIKGVYAAGDIRKKRFKQITTAVSDGTIAALMAEKHITEGER